MKYKRKQRFNIYKILSIILIIFFIFLTPIIIQKLIKVNKIECRSQFGECSEDLGYKINVANDYKTTKKRIEQQVKSDIQINNYLIQYKIPSTIKIDLSLKKPRFIIKDQSNKLYLIDKVGLIIGLTNESNLPTLVNSNVIYKIADNISSGDKFALEILEKVVWLYSIREGVIEREQLKIKLEKGILVRFPLEGDVDVLVGSLRLIFSRLNDTTNGIRIEDISEIDLRFKNALLR